MGGAAANALCGNANAPPRRMKAAIANKTFLICYCRDWHLLSDCSAPVARVVRIGVLAALSLCADATSAEVCSAPEETSA